jgi:hypothetical protein
MPTDKEIAHIKALLHHLETIKHDILALEIKKNKLDRAHDKVSVLLHAAQKLVLKKQMREMHKLN